MMLKVKAQDELKENATAPLSLEHNKTVPDKMSNQQRLYLLPMDEHFSGEGDKGRSSISVRAATMRRIQRNMGNTVAMRLAGSPAALSHKPVKHLVQPKLSIGQPGDMLEKEANAAAGRISAGKPVDQVSRITSRGFPQKNIPPPKKEVEEENTQRREREESSPERKTDTDAAERAISRSCTGAPLCPMMRKRMEENFGADFSDVRIHTGEAAHEAAEALNARAFTHGNHIYLARGESANDSGLMGHELAHTIHQGAVPIEDGHLQRSNPSRALAMPNDRPPDDHTILTMHPGNVGIVVQLTQHPAAARQSRITVAASAHSFRTTTQNRLTQQLLNQLRNIQQSPAEAVAIAGGGRRTFGTSPSTGPEPASTALGVSAATGGAATHRAVIVGNGQYDQTATMGSAALPLRGRNISTAVSDARAIASALQARGYDVRQHENQTASEISGLLQSGIAGLGTGDQLVFYFHGHGTMEGLIGRDGSVYTPTQMAALRSTARNAQVELTLALEGCHTGIFVDAIRGAELRDTLSAMRLRVRATTGVVQYVRQLLLPVLNSAIAIQGHKDAFNAQVRTWWERRYQIEQQMTGSNVSASVHQTWGAHYNLLLGLWNNLVAVVTPLLSTLRTNAIAAGFNVELSQQITPLAGPLDVTGEEAIQAGLDDLDTILNRVLRETDSRLR